MTYNPDPTIYCLMIEQCGICPSRSLILDDLIDNCRAAEVFGLDTYNAVSGESFVPFFNFK